MSEWKKARKKPVVIEYREVQPNADVESMKNTVEIIETREGHLMGYKGQDYIIRGVEGELYPIKIDIFEKTYERVEE